MNNARRIVLPAVSQPRLPPIRHEPGEARRPDKSRQRGCEWDDAPLQAQVRIQQTRHCNSNAFVPESLDEASHAPGSLDERIVVHEQVPISDELACATVGGAGIADVLL